VISGQVADAQAPLADKMGLASMLDPAYFYAG
jgi:hypothetical protein